MGDDAHQAKCLEFVVELTRKSGTPNEMPNNVSVNGFHFQLIQLISLKFDDQDRHEMAHEFAKYCVLSKPRSLLPTGTRGFGFGVLGW